MNVRKHTHTHTSFLDDGVNSDDVLCRGWWVAVVTGPVRGAVLARESAWWKSVTGVKRQAPVREDSPHKELRPAFPYNFQLRLLCEMVPSSVKESGYSGTVLQGDKKIIK